MEGRERGNSVHFSNTYPKWRVVLVKANAAGVFLALLLELLMYFVYLWSDRMLYTAGGYFLRFLLLPVAANLIILAAGLCLLNYLGKEGKRQSVLNYIPILQMVLICFVLSSVHYAISVAYAIYCFPIFLTTMFEEPLMLPLVTVLCAVGMTVSRYLGPIIDGSKDPGQLADYVASVGLLLAANMLCTVLVRFHEEKNGTIRRIRGKQLEIQEQLYVDQKTGLYGSTAFLSRLGEVVEQGNLRSAPALAVLDIDNFKLINDTYGHAKGDEVILGLARLMQDMCGDKFFPARFGGEEFAIIFTGGHRWEYLMFVERLRTTFSQTQYDFTDRRITLSAGLAYWHPNWTSEDFFDAADGAMYRSKAYGKNKTTECGR